MSQGLYVKQVYACGGTGTSGMTSVVKGIKITYSDGSTDQQGHFFGAMASCKTLDIDVQGGERVTEIEMRGPGDGQWLARLRIKTNKGNELFVSKNYCGFWSCNYADKYEMKGAELGEGIILGMSGQQEKGDTGNQPHIRCLTFRLLQKVTDREVINVQLSNLPEPKLVGLDSVEKPNPSKTDVVIGGTCIEYKERDTEGGSWTESTTDSIGGQFKITYGTPKLVWGAEGSVNYQYTETTTDMTTWEEEKAKTFTTCFPLPKLSKYRYDVYYYVGKGDVDWTGTMIVDTEGGTWWFKTAGKYKMVATSEIREDATKIAKYVNHEWVPCSGITCS